MQTRDKLLAAGFAVLLGSEAESSVAQYPPRILSRKSRDSRSTVDLHSDFHSGTQASGRLAETP
jgi:hypothetical protein